MACIAVEKANDGSMPDSTQSAGACAPASLAAAARVPQKSAEVMGLATAAGPARGAVRDGARGLGWLRGGLPARRAEGGLSADGAGRCPRYGLAQFWFTVKSLLAAREELIAFDLLSFSVI
jgi:hypothetical protein